MWARVMKWQGCDSQVTFQEAILRFVQILWPVLTLMCFGSVRIRKEHSMMPNLPEVTLKHLAQMYKAHHLWMKKFMYDKFNLMFEISVRTAMLY